MTKKTAFFEGCSWFKFNNLGLALSTNLKFYASLSKGLKLKVKKFWELILTFVEVTGEKLVRGTFLPSPPSWIGLRKNQAALINREKVQKGLKSWVHYLAEDVPKSTKYQYTTFSRLNTRDLKIKAKIILKLIFQLQSKFEKKTMGAINHRKTENILNLTLGAVVGRALHKSY